ncbi:MAG: hypothetical protein JW761_14180 [Prolixibacteraceae bacterium]|nr:hypothetical protein [Prolixibacteraceae bacterium]
MKQIFLWMAIVVFIVACSSQKKMAHVPQVEKEEIAEDSVEYDLETFDAKFETWYQLHNNPSQFRTLQYYESWNRQYVNAWNANAMNPGKSSFFETIIGYDPQTEYGFELNHELFYYFQYVENVLKIEIMPNSPNVVRF